MISRLSFTFLLSLITIAAIFGVLTKAESEDVLSVPEPFAADDALALLAPQAKFKVSNRTVDGAKTLKERSLLFEAMQKRQNCNPGYGYCASAGGCCPSDNRCCSYGYCLEPGNICCPTGPCDPGEDCCGRSHCHPEGTECCSDESYCEAGNICVIVKSTGQRGCCTDLSCTAHVEGGSTIYLTTSDYTPPTSRVPSASSRPPATITQVNIQYYYYVYTWYYYAYFYTTIQQVSSVTYTRVTTYTTLSVEASNSREASSLISELTETISLTPPEDASTELELSLSDAPTQPTGIESPTVFTSGPGNTQRTRSVAAGPTGDPTQVIGGGPPAGSGPHAYSIFGGGGMVGLCSLLALPGFLMLWL